MFKLAFAGLGAHQAAAFTATAGYQAGGDFLIDFASPTTAIDQRGMFI